MTKKKQINKLLELKPEINIEASIKYKIVIIKDSVIYTIKTID